MALLAFLVTGIVASQLAERARREAKISRRRQREAERLYEFSQQMLVTGNVIDLLNVLPQMIAATFNLAGAAVYLREKDRVYRSSPNYMDVTAAELRDAAFTRDHRRDEERGVTLVPILLGTASDRRGWNYRLRGPRRRRSMQCAAWPPLPLNAPARSRR